MIEITPEMASLAGFAEHILEIPMHDWQRDIHFAIEEALLSGHPVQMAIRCPNEAGKTAHIAAPLALSLPMLYPHSLLVYTSAVGRQVDSQFMPAVARHKSNPVFAGWDFKTHTIEAPNGARVEAFTTNDPGRFEGWHNRPPVKLPSGESYMPPLVMVIDEAKTVPDAIYTAVDRCHPDVLILISSADHATLAGEFYRAFTKHRTLYQCWEIGLTDCPHIPREKIQKIIDKDGETHPFVRASIYGEFPEALDEGIIIPNALITPCLWRERMAEPPFPRVGMDKVAWCDFAAGGDENVVAMRTGNLVGIEAAWREKDTMAVTVTTSEVYRVLQHPNPYMTMYDFLYKVASLYYASNNAFIWPEYDDTGALVALWPVNYRCFKLLEYDGVLIARFELRHNHFYTVPYEEVIHLRNHFFNDDLLGDDNSPFNPVADLMKAQNEGIIEGIKNSAIIRG